MITRFQDFDKYDFDMYGGAESFSDGTRPQIWEFVGTVSLDNVGNKELTIILAREGIDFMFSDEDGNVVEYHLDVEDNLSLCRVIVAGMEAYSRSYKQFSDKLFSQMQFAKIMG